MSEWHDLQKDPTDMPFLDAKNPWRTFDVLAEDTNGGYLVCHYNQDEEGWIDQNGFRHTIRAWQDIEPRSQKTAKKAVALMSPDIKSAMAYLSARGIKKAMIKNIYQAFCTQALLDGDSMRVDRIYTAFALAVRRAYGFGYERIKRTFREFSQLMDHVTEDDCYWDDLMDELYQQTGMVIHCASDYDRIMVEYRCPNGEIEELTDTQQAMYDDLLESMEAK